MTRKVYAMTGRMNNASIILTGKTGNRVRMEFQNGSAAQNVPATFMTENEYYQYLLESSDYFKRGLIKIKQVIDTGDVKKPSIVKLEKKSVPSVKDAIQWIADTFGEKVTSGHMAVELAKKKGYNLIIG